VPTGPVCTAALLGDLQLAVRGLDGVVGFGFLGRDLLCADQRLTLTHSAADAEQKRGFLRLYVDHARAEQDKFEVVIAQSLTMGQFCLDSAKKPSNYEQLFPQEEQASVEAGDDGYDADADM
jgi:hypothetical protein